MIRKPFLILVITCLVAFIGYRIYMSSRLREVDVDKDKKQKGRQTVQELSTIQKTLIAEKKLLKVKGIVREKRSKKPLSGAKINLRRFTGEIEELTTDAEGSFNFEIGSPEAIELIATLKGYVKGSLMYESGKEAVLELIKCGMIKGTITHMGFPIPKTKVSLYSDTTDKILNYAESDSKGEFALSDVVPTRGKMPTTTEEIMDWVKLTLQPYSLKIEHPDYCTLWIFDIKIKEDETLHYKIELERYGIIEGTIYHESSKLSDDIMVRIRTEDCDHVKKDFKMKPRVESDLFDSYIVMGANVNAGKYTLRLPQGDYHMIADPSGNLTTYKSSCIRLEVGDKITHDIYLKTGKTISGVVMDEASKPLSNIDLSIWSQSDEVLIPSSEGSWQPALMNSASYTTNEDGRFTFQGLTDGLYTVIARDMSDKYEEVEVKDVKAGSNDVRIILKKIGFEQRRADVEVKVATITNKVSDDSFIYFVREDLSRAGLGRAEKFISGGGLVRNGVYKRDDYLPDGAYTILAFDRNQNLYSIIYNHYITKLQKNQISMVLDRKGAQIKGKVLKGRIYNFRLSIDKQRNREFDCLALVDEDEDGNFDVSGLPPGYVTIDFGTKWQKVQFELGPGEVKDLGTIELKQEK